MIDPTEVMHPAFVQRAHSYLNTITTETMMKRWFAYFAVACFLMPSIIGCAPTPEAETTAPQDELEAWNEANPEPLEEIDPDAE